MESEKKQRIEEAKEFRRMHGKNVFEYTIEEGDERLVNVVCGCGYSYIGIRFCDIEENCPLCGLEILKGGK